MMHRLLAAAARPQPLLAPSRALSVVAARASKAALLRPLQQPQGALRRLVSSAPSRTHSCLVARTVVGGVGAGPCASASLATMRRHPFLASTLRRRLCTGSSSSGGGGGSSSGTMAGNVTMVKQAATWANQNRAVVGVLAAATCVMYGFYRASMYTMHFFFNVSDKTIFELGFLAGILATVGIASAGALANRHLSVSTGQVYRAALAKLRTHEAVEKSLGEFWRSSGFRGYKVESLKEAVQGSERRARTSYLEAPSRRVQMVFMVKGIERTGMVSLQAHKRGGDYNFDMLALDLLPSSDGSKPAQHIFLEGDADMVLFSELGLLLDATRSSGRREAARMDAV
jgi:hypothetical protein